MTFSVFCRASTLSKMAWSTVIQNGSIVMVQTGGFTLKCAVESNQQVQYVYMYADVRRYSIYYSNYYAYIRICMCMCVRTEERFLFTANFVFYITAVHAYTVKPL